MSYKPRSLLCLVLVLLMAIAAVPAMAANVPVTGYAIYGENVGLGTGIFNDEGTAMALTGHKLQIAPADVQPADAKMAFTYKSSKAAVASINAKGLITCKKQGTTTITITSKYGKVMRSFPLTVYANESGFTSIRGEMVPGYYTATAKRVYIKGGKLMVDMYYYNGGTKSLHQIKNAAVYFSLDYEEEAYMLLGSNFSGKAKKAIKPGNIGVVTISLNKVSASEIMSSVLLRADAYISGDHKYKGGMASQAAAKAMKPRINWERLSKVNR